MRSRRSAPRPPPEHLRRAFRLVSEIVFCFDGDRAGRAAAWRALQKALPEAREGREIRFLFLPEGEDPDSLVGQRGRRALRGAPRQRACRCRSTWSRSCASRPTSAMPTARRTSSRWRGRCWRRSRPASIASCCSSASPRRSAAAERLQQWLAVAATHRTQLRQRRARASSAPRARRAAPRRGRPRQPDHAGDQLAAAFPRPRPRSAPSSSAANSTRCRAAGRRRAARAAAEQPATARGHAWRRRWSAGASGRVPAALRAGSQRAAGARCRGGRRGTARGGRPAAAMRSCAAGWKR